MLDMAIRCLSRVSSFMASGDSTLRLGRCSWYSFEAPDSTEATIKEDATKNATDIEGIISVKIEKICNRAGNQRESPEC